MIQRVPDEKAPPADVPVQIVPHSLQYGPLNGPYCQYGILMPDSYGFPPEKVKVFMLQSFELFINLRDPDLGLSTDENRLVQRWVWFSSGSDLYPTGDLFSRDGTPTQLMRAYSAYLDEFGP